MKKFFLKSLFFLILGIFLLNFVIAPMLLSSHWARFHRPLFRYWITQNIEAIIPPETNTIILGDSVGRQIFGNALFDTNGFKNSFATNAATSMIGQYIFVYHALMTNKNIKNVVIAVVPHSLSLPFEHRQAYAGILKSFYTFENRKHFSHLIRAKIARKFPANFIVLPMIKISKCFPDINFSYPGSYEGIKNRTLSDVSIEYLKKFKELAEKKNVQLKLVCPPVAKYNFNQYKDFRRMKKQVKENGLEDIFKGYFRNIVYLDKDFFNTDVLHLKDEYIAREKNKIISKILSFPYTVKKNNLNLILESEDEKKGKLYLTKMHPSMVMAGQTFDSKLVISFTGNNFTKNTMAVWNEGSMPTKFLTHQKVVATIPDFYYEKAGSCKVYMYDRKTHRESNSLQFQIKKPYIKESLILSRYFKTPISVSLSNNQSIPIVHTHSRYRIEIEAERKGVRESWGRWQINWHDDHHKLISTSLIPFKLDSKRRVYISPIIKNIPASTKLGYLYINSHNENPILIHSFKLIGIDIDFSREQI